MTSQEEGMKRSTSFCNQSALTNSNMPKRSQSFRSCLKKGPSPDYESRPSSRKNSGNKAVMFSDEVGENLVIVNKYEVKESPVEPQDLDSDDGDFRKRSLKNRGENRVTRGQTVEAGQTENGLAMEQANGITTNGTTAAGQGPSEKLRRSSCPAFSNPRISKSQSFNVSNRPRVAKRDMNKPPPNSPQSCSPMMSPSLNKRDRIPSITLTLPRDDSLSDIEDNLEENLDSSLGMKNSGPKQKFEIKMDIVSVGSLSYQSLKMKPQCMNNSTETCSPPLPTHGIEMMAEALVKRALSDITSSAAANSQKHQQEVRGEGLQRWQGVNGSQNQQHAGSNGIQNQQHVNHPPPPKIAPPPLPPL